MASDPDDGIWMLRFMLLGMWLAVFGIFGLEVWRAIRAGEW